MRGTGSFIHTTWLVVVQSPQINGKCGFTSSALGGEGHVAMRFYCIEISFSLLLTSDA